MGCPTVAHMQVVGAASLLAWRHDVATAALATWSATCRRLLRLQPHTGPVAAATAGGGGGNGAAACYSRGSGGSSSGRGGGWAGGYLVEAGEGHMLAAFGDAGAAAVWSYACTEAMLDVDWWVFDCDCACGCVVDEHVHVHGCECV